MSDWHKSHSIQLWLLSQILTFKNGMMQPHITHLLYYDGEEFFESIRLLVIEKITERFQMFTDLFVSPQALLLICNAKGLFVVRCTIVARTSATVGARSIVVLRTSAHYKLRRSQSLRASDYSVSRRVGRFHRATKTRVVAFAAAVLPHFVVASATWGRVQNGMRPEHPQRGGPGSWAGSVGMHGDA